MSPAFKWFLRFIVAIPTIFLVLRGFTIAIGQATEAYGKVMTDLISQIVFWLFVALGVTYFIVYIGTKLKERLSKTKIISSTYDIEHFKQSDRGIEVKINPIFSDMNREQIIAFFEGLSKWINGGEYAKTAKEKAKTTTSTKEKKSAKKKDN